MKIKRNDQVIVIAGDDKSDVPRRVLQVLDGGQKVVVEGVNEVYRHVKRGHPKSPQGGRLRMEKPIRSSNVMYYCDGCNSKSKLGLRYTDEGAKERFCRSCGRTAGQISPPRPQYAKST